MNCRSDIVTSNGELIVEFPTFELEEPRAVSFKPVIDIAIIPQDFTKSFSQEDFDAFKRERSVAVHVLRRKLASTPAKELGNAFLLHCIGLERFLSPDVMMATMTAREDHIDAILDEQRAQVLTGTNDAERLASVSMRSSRWARNRAEQIALGYFRLEE